MTVDMFAYGHIFFAKAGIPKWEKRKRTIFPVNIEVFYDAYP